MKKVTVSAIATLMLLAPFAASAADDVCKTLIPEIVRNYEVANLEVMRNGNPRISKSMVSCTYKAVTPTMSGDLPVIVTALLNTDNKRFTVEIR